MPSKKSAPRAPKRPKTAATDDGAAESTSVMPPSKWFYSYARKAEPLVKNKEKLAELVRGARAKTTATRESRKAFRPVRHQLESMLRLVEAHAAGSAPKVSFNSVVVSTAGLLYLIAPGDLVPDWMPGTGMADDVAVLGMAYEVAKKDADAFQPPARAGWQRFLFWKQ